MFRRLSTRQAITAIAVGLVLTSCGGSDTPTDDQPGTTSSAPTTATAPASVTETSIASTSSAPSNSTTVTAPRVTAAPEEVTSDTHPSGAVSAGTAKVSVGGVDYEFILIECETHDNGSVFGAGDSAGSGYDENRYVFTGSSLTFRIQAAGSSVSEFAEAEDRHFIRVTDNDEALEWNAGAGPFKGAVTAEHSHIQNWTRNEESAAGTASFIEEGESYREGGTPAIEIGEFQITCS